MDVQEVPCFAVVPSTDIDEDDGFSTEALDQLHGNPLDRQDVGLSGLTHQGWHWFGQSLRLRVKPCQVELI